MSSSSSSSGPPPGADPPSPARKDPFHVLNIPEKDAAAPKEGDTDYRYLRDEFVANYDTGELKCRTCSFKKSWAEIKPPETRKQKNLNKGSFACHLTCNAHAAAVEAKNKVKGGMFAYFPQKSVDAGGGDRPRGPGWRSGWRSG